MREISHLRWESLCHLEQISNQCFTCQTNSLNTICMVSVCHTFNFLTFATQPILYMIICFVLGAVSDKCSGFCKCLRFSKSGFATFTNSAGHQKWPPLSSSDRRSMMVMMTTIKYILALLLTSTLYYML